LDLIDESRGPGWNAGVAGTSNRILMIKPGRHSTIDDCTSTQGFFVLDESKWTQSNH